MKGLIAKFGFFTKKDTIEEEIVEEHKMNNFSPRHILSSEGVWFVPEKSSLDDEEIKKLKDAEKPLIPTLYRARLAPPPDILEIISKPLPTPPLGYFWRKKDDSSTWELIKREEFEVYNRVKTFPTSSFIEHVVMPDDTIQGICLRYRTSKLELRRNNNFSGDAFRSRKVLRIKIDPNCPVELQEDTIDIKIQKLKNMIGEDTEECRYYLSENDWDLIKAINAWQNDLNWEQNSIGRSIECAGQTSKIVRPYKIKYYLPEISPISNDDLSNYYDDQSNNLEMRLIP